MDRWLAADIRALEEVVMADSSDSDSEELLLELYRERDEALALASQGRRLRPPFSLHDISRGQATLLFRFAKDDLEPLRLQLRIPDVMRSANGTAWSGLEGLCMVLRRLCTPTRLVDLEEVFRRGKSESSIIINDTLRFLYNEWGRLLSDLAQHRQHWLTAEKLDDFCRAVSVSCPLDNVWAFIDGTTRPICRPTYNQRLWYSGHKRKHVMKFQSLMTPCGIVPHLFGPFEGRRHDSAMLDASGLLQQLQDNMERADGGVYSVYGDSGYPLREHILCPFKGAHLTNEQQLFNTRMSAARVSVEWGYSGVTQQFSFLQHKENLKIGLQPVAQYYVVATLLYNCFICLYGSQIATYFNVDPPSLEDYLQ